jgi:hypothetical protein
MAERQIDRAIMTQCGKVAMAMVAEWQWQCGSVAGWQIGSVAVWQVGRLAVWQIGRVAEW